MSSMNLRLLVISLICVLAGCSGSETLVVETATPADTVAPSTIPLPTTVITQPPTPFLFHSRTPTSPPRSTYTPRASTSLPVSAQDTPQSLTPTLFVARNCAGKPSQDRVGLQIINYVGGTEPVEFSILGKVHPVPPPERGGQTCVDLPIGSHAWNAKLKKHDGAPNGVVRVIANRPLEPINFCLVDNQSTLSTICQSGPPTPTPECCD